MSRGEVEPGGKCLFRVESGHLVVRFMQHPPVAAVKKMAISGHPTASSVKDCSSSVMLSDDDSQRHHRRRCFRRGGPDAVKIWAASVGRHRGATLVSRVRARKTISRTRTNASLAEMGSCYPNVGCAV
jgi:hypothetical protein